MPTITRADIERGVARFKNGERPWSLRSVDWYISTSAGELLPLKYVYALSTNQPPAEFSTNQAKASLRALGYGFVLQDSEGGQSHDTLISDLGDIDVQPDLAPTTRSALVEARLGQGKYRSQLLDIWGGACAVTGCGVRAVLRASHCKPWRDSDNRERLDANNGLMLVANLDALFDVGMIGFQSDGAMLASEGLAKEDLESLGLPAPLRRKPSVEQEEYLAFHRSKWFPEETA